MVRQEGIHNPRRVSQVRQHVLIRSLDGPYELPRERRERRRPNHRREIGGTERLAEARQEAYPDDLPQLVPVLVVVQHDAAEAAPLDLVVHTCGGDVTVYLFTR